MQELSTTKSHAVGLTARVPAAYRSRRRRYVPLTAWGRYYRFWLRARKNRCRLLAPSGLSERPAVMSALGVCVQPVSATPLVVYRLAFGSPRSFADVD